jgi:hypothetical protein
VTFWDVHSGRRLSQRTLRVNQGPRDFVYLSPDCRFVLDDTQTGRVNVLEPGGKTHVSIALAEDLEFPRPPARLAWVPQEFQAFTPDSSLLTVSRMIPARQPGLVRRWLGNWWPVPAWIMNMVVVVVDLDSGRELFRSETHDVADLRISDDGRTLVTTHFEGNDAVISCWDVPSRPPLHWVVGIPLMLGGVVLLVRWWRTRRAARQESSQRPMM